MESLTLVEIRDSIIVLVAVLGFIVLLGNAIKTFKGWKTPVDDRKKWQTEVDDKLKKDNDRLKTLEDGNRVICRGIMALLSHEVNGNSDDKLKKSLDEIQEYLLEK